MINTESYTVNVKDNYDANLYSLFCLYSEISQFLLTQILFLSLDILYWIIEIIIIESLLLKNGLY